MSRATPPADTGVWATNQGFAVIRVDLVATIARQRAAVWEATCAGMVDAGDETAGMVGACVAAELGDLADHLDLLGISTMSLLAGTDPVVVP